MTNQTPMEPQPLTRTEAIRRAVLALGYRAPVLEILDYVRQHFGIGGEPGLPAPQAPAPALPAPEAQAPEEPPVARPQRRGKAKGRPGQPE